MFLLKLFFLLIIVSCGYPPDTPEDKVTQSSDSQKRGLRHSSGTPDEPIYLSPELSKENTDKIEVDLAYCKKNAHNLTQSEKAQCRSLIIKMNDQE